MKQSKTLSNNKLPRKELIRRSSDIDYKHSQLKEVVLATLGIGVLLGGTVLITPNFPIILGVLLKAIQEIKGVKIPKSKLKRVLRNLEKRKIIDIKEDGDEISVKVRDRNHIEILKYSLKEVIGQKRKSKWTGKWFLVVFDVPEEERNKRDYLRKLLEQIGFRPYQKSVYVYPYECEKEISLVKKIVEGGKYISYITADRLEYEDKLKSDFGLS